MPSVISLTKTMTPVVRAYKICRLRNGAPAALFHATAAGTRDFPPGEWLTATDKTVRDGSGDGWYRSGFHTFPTYPNCVQYLKRFKRREDLCIVEVEIGGEVWRKPRTRSSVQLSTRMKVLRIITLVRELE